jgi:hypothetical protein
VREIEVFFDAERGEVLGKITFLVTKCNVDESDLKPLIFQITPRISKK